MDQPFEIDVHDLDNVLLFDGHCKFCNGAVNFVLEHERNSSLKFLPLQSALGKKVLAHFGYNEGYIESILFLSSNTLKEKSAAALEVSRFLNRPWSMLRVVGGLPLWMLDWVYDIIAKNRYKWFGQTSRCMIPSSNYLARFLE